MHQIIEIFRNSIYIAGLVIIMMLVIEYFNVATRGHQFTKVQKSPARQVLIGAILGLIPGCMGGFAAVSLFSHNIFGFGALLATMISDTGDETFVMFSAFPQYALLIKAITFTLGVIAGMVVNIVVQKRQGSMSLGYNYDHELEIHEHAEHTGHFWNNVRNNIKKLSGVRLIVVLAILFFILSLVTGQMEHDHSKHEMTETEYLCDEHSSMEDFPCENHEHIHNSHDGSFFFNEYWINILFAIFALGALFIVLGSDEHFFTEHIMHHVIYKHLLRIFLWTFGSLLAIYGLSLFVGFDQWLHENKLTMLLLAIGVGLIPQSGPHIVFISLFMSGQIGLSVLLANSIVQNGHSGLPLLAASRKSFVKVKLIGAFIALIVGLLGYFIGF